MRAPVVTALRVLRAFAGNDAVALVTTTDDVAAHRILGAACWCAFVAGEPAGVVRGAVRALVQELEAARSRPRRSRESRGDVSRDPRRLQ